MGIRPRHVWLSVVVAALSVGAVACGSSSKQVVPSQTTTTAAVSQGAGTTGPEAASTTPGGTTAAPVAVCSTLPTSQAAALSAKALTTNREQDFAADNAYTCAYFTASGTGGISVTVTTVGGATAYQNSFQNDKLAQTEHVMPLTGLGDKAFAAQDGVHALFGDRLILVAGLTSVPPAEAIVRAVQAKLS
jgi:hypothetical protein